MEIDPLSLIRKIDRVGKRVRDHIHAICLNVLLLIFGPGLILVGVHALPPAWRPGLHWPLDGERAAAAVEGVHLALRHVDDDARIDNVQARVAVTLAYRDREGALRHAMLTGPWMLQLATQFTGDAAWFYLADIGRELGMGAIDVDMPRDVAAQLALPHERFGPLERTAENLDRPLRWVALAWLAPERALSVHYDARRPDVAIPDALIERESTRLEGVGMLRIGAFVLGCLLVGVLAWNACAFRRRRLRVLAAGLVVGTVLWWAPYAGTLVRIVMPGIDTWSGLDMNAVVADPLAPFYDEFRSGPYYVAASAPPPVHGVSWSAENLSAHALTSWLRTIPAAPVRGSLEDAEAALARAAVAALPRADDGTLRAVGADAKALSLRREWIGITHYVELREAVRAELVRRGLPDDL